MLFGLLAAGVLKNVGGHGDMTTATAAVLGGFWALLALGCLVVLVRSLR